MARNASKKGSKWTATLTINRIIDFIFVLIVIIFILWEVFCYKNCLKHKPNCFNPDEAKFYINNIIIILCPFVDSTVGIAFSAYNDRIYGLTIGELKETARYHGYSFFEMIVISLLLVVVCVLLFYFDLLVTDIVVNFIGLLYCLFFTIWDVSLLARSKWRIYGIGKRKYKYEMKKYRGDSIRASSNIIFSYFDNGIRQDSEKTAKGIYVKIHDVLNDFESSKFEVKKSISMQKKLVRNLTKIKSKRYVKNIDKFLMYLNKYMHSGIKKIVINAPENDDDLKCFLDVVDKLISCLYSKFNGLTIYTDLQILNIQLEATLRPKLTNFLCPNLKTLISNMVVTDGFLFTLNKFNAKAVSELDACFTLQNNYLSLVSDDDLSAAEQCLTQCINNINQCACISYPNDKLIESLMINSSKWLSQVVADAINSFVLSVNRIHLDVDKDFHLNWTINYILPTLLKDKENSWSNEAIALREYHNLLSTTLLRQTLSNQDIWFCKKIIGLYYPHVTEDGCDLSGYFYVLASFYLYFLCTQPDISKNFKDQVDAQVKVRMSEILRSILTAHGAGHILGDDEMLELLKNIVDAYSSYDNWDFKRDYNNPDLAKHNKKFDLRTIIKYWFQIIDCLDCQFYLFNDFSKFDSILGENLSEWVVGIFFEYLQEMEKTHSIKLYDFFNFYGIDHFRSQEETSHRSILNIKKAINNSFKEQALNSVRLESRQKLMFDKASSVLKLIEPNFSSFALFKKNVNTKGAKTFNVAFKKFIDINELNSSDSLLVFKDGQIGDFQKEVLKTIFKTIFDSVKSSMPSHVHEVDDYSAEDVTYIKSLPYSNRYVGDYEQESDVLAITFESLFNAKRNLQQGVKFPYDIFFKDDAIKVNLRFSKQPSCESISTEDEDEIISCSNNFAKDGTYHCKRTNTAFAGVYVSLTRDEYAKFLTGQKIKVEFEIECIVDVNPQDIEIYKLKNK